MSDRVRGRPKKLTTDEDNTKNVKVQRSRGRPPKYTPEEREEKYKEKKREYYNNNYEYIRDLKMKNYREDKAIVNPAPDILETGENKVKEVLAEL